MRICCRGHHLHHGHPSLQHCAHQLCVEGTQFLVAGSSPRRLPQQVKELLILFWPQRRRRGRCEEKHLNLWACTHIPVGRTFAKPLTKSNPTMKWVSKIRKFEIPPVAYGCNNSLWPSCAVIFTHVVTLYICSEAPHIHENSRAFNMKIFFAIIFQY